MQENFEVPLSKKAKNEVMLVRVILSPAYLIMFLIFSSVEISVIGILATKISISSSPMPKSNKEITHKIYTSLKPI